MKILKRLTLAVATAMLGLPGLAQSPAAPATPTLDPSQVTTIMGYYGNADGLVMSAYSKGTSYEEVTIDGVKMWKMSNFDYAKFDFSAIDLSGREKIHIDLYTPADGMSGFMKINFTNGNNSSASKTPQQVVAKGEWTSRDYVIADVFKGGSCDFSKVSQFVLGDTDRSELKTVYVTNVYAYGGTGQGSTGGGGSNPDPGTDPNPGTDPTPGDDTVNSFPKSTLDANNVFSIMGQFGDADGLTVSAYSKNDAYERVEIDGVKVWKLSSFDYAKFDFSAVDFTKYDKIHVDLYTSANGMSGLMKINFTNGNNSSASKTPQQVVAKGEWTSRDYVIADVFSGGVCDMSAVSQFVLGDTNRTELKTIYVGNVYLFNGEGGTSTPDPGTDPGTDPNPGTDPTPSDDTVPAVPVPTVAAENVKSITGHFGDAPGLALSAYSKGSGCNKVSVGEETVWKMSSFDYAKFDFSGIDFTKYDKIHIDLYTPANGMSGLMKINFTNGSNSTASKTPQQVISKGEWTSRDYVIADVFSGGACDMTAVKQFVLGDTNRDELKTVYIGNVYLFNGEGGTVTPDPGTDPNPGTDPEPGTAEVPGPAPTPKHDADDILNVYSDAYAKWANFAPQGWSAATFEEVQLAEGDNAWKFKNYDWVAANIGDRDVSSKGFLHMDVFTPPSARLEKIQIGFAYWSSGQHYSEPITLTPGKWNSIDIAINEDNFGDFDFTKCNVLRLQGSGKMAGCTVYIDNFYFYGDPQESTVDPNAYQPIQDNSDGVLPDRETPMFGVNLASASGGKIPGTFGYDYIYPRVQDLYYYKAKGVQLIRLPFRAARVLHNLDDQALDYADGDKSDILALKAVVDEAERLGIWVLLDAHDYSERTIDGVQHKIGDDVYTNDKFARMWKMIAEAFSGNKNIWGFDLQNEPKSNTATLMAAYQPTIDAIREVNGDAFIVIEGCNWASAYQWSKPANDANSNLPLLNLVDPQDKIVYQAHCYFDKDNSGTYQGSFDNIATNLDGMITRLSPFYETMKANGKRGLLGEFGVPYNGAANSDPRYMDLLDATLDWMRPYQQWATIWCGGAMYEANALSVQPDKSNIYGNYAVEKSTMKVVEKYIPIWANAQGGTEDGVDDIIADQDVSTVVTYNLQGMRVPNGTKGLVIVNGKKVINR